MKYPDDIDEKTLGAFVDGQLDAAHRSSVIEAMDKDPGLREQVYQLRRAKDLMKLGFEDVKPAGAAGKPARAPRRHAFNMAASVTVLAIGFGAGSLGWYCTGRLESVASAPAMATAIQPQSDHVVLHVDDSDPRHFLAALNYAERFIETNRGGEIEVVANAGGLDLMRSGLSPYEQRLVDMIKRHDNVRFVACANAIRKLEQQGIEPHIISNVDTGETALEHIIERVQAGWSYIKVESLPEA